MHASTTAAFTAAFTALTTLSASAFAQEAASPSPATQPTPVAWSPTTQPCMEEDYYVAPRVVDYEGGDIPRNAKLKDAARIELIALGLAGSAGMYGASVLYALSTCAPQEKCRAGSDSLYIPVIGPFLTAGVAPTTGGRAVAIFDGVVQTAGIGLAAVALLFPKKVLVISNKRGSLEVQPISAGSGMGLGVTMTHF